MLVLMNKTVFLDIAEWLKQHKFLYYSMIIVSFLFTFTVVPSLTLCFDDMMI
jgi:hypothetical protein